MGTKKVCQVLSLAFNIKIKRTNVCYYVKEDICFYTLPDDYIDYLNSIEPKVCFNKKQKRPYIGIVFKVGNINYFAPFASPKPKHKNMREAIDYIKVKDGKLGIINLNNMIPVPLELCTKVNISKLEDCNYKILIQKQYLWCNKKNNYENIISSAKSLYHIICSNNCGTSLMNRCCNYKLLEEKYLYYNSKKQGC